MVRALRVVTVQRGIDPRGYALLAFGGAGGLHATRIADELGIDRVLCPRASGVLSALGLVVSPRRRDVQRSVLITGADLTAERIAELAAELGEQARQALGAPDGELSATYELRYRGQAFELPVAGPLEPDVEALREAFEAEHEDRYGYRGAGQELELVTIRVTAKLAESALELSADSSSDGDADDGHTMSATKRAGPPHETTGRRRSTASRSNSRCGVARRLPVPGSTAPPWSSSGLDAAGLTGMVGLGARVGDDRAGARAMIDPVELQVLSGALHSICDEMGAVLIRSAHSANIKERRDASTALFTPEGEMVMQAEHIPVHLGAMPAAVAAVLDSDHAPGRSWILNDPYRGGTHLPDITVITPVFAGEGAPAGPPERRLIAFAANRAHHADVGGPTPGSMPADSTRLADEGVVIEPRILDDAAIEELTAQMRRPDQRRADLRAQLAAGRIGVRRLTELYEQVGAQTLTEAFAAVLDYAERRMRSCLTELEDGERTAQDVLEAREGDLTIALRATVRGDRLTLDFTGTDPQHEGNLNCPEAVTRSACYFAVRVLTDPDIPATAGAYRPIEVIAPEGSLLNARASGGDRRLAGRRRG